MDIGLSLPNKNFERVRKALLCQEPDRIPLMEMDADVEAKERFLGKPVRDMKSNVEFWARAGYDYVYIRANYEYNVWGSKIPPYRLYAGEAQERGLVNLTGVITNEAGFDSYPWPEPETIDYSTIVQTADNLWEGMKVISGVGGIFTRAWRILGFENFCLYLIDKSDLVEKIFRRVGDIQLQVFKKIVSMDNIGAMWYGDDLGFANSTMVSPDVYRKYLFPYLEEMGRICRQRDIPFIVHSHGNINEILNDLYLCGFNAIHPVGPGTMDIVEVKKEWKDRLCLLGNVSAFTMESGTPEQIEENVKYLIRRVGPGGGYCVATSGGITLSVPLENHKALIHSTLKHGKYPLSL